METWPQTEPPAAPSDLGCLHRAPRKWAHSDGLTEGVKWAVRHQAGPTGTPGPTHPHDTEVREQEGTCEPLIRVMWGASQRDMGGPGRSHLQQKAPRYGFSVNSNNGKRASTRRCTYMYAHM